MYGEEVRKTWLINRDSLSVLFTRFFHTRGKPAIRSVELIELVEEMAGYTDMLTVCVVKRTFLFRVLFDVCCYSLRKVTSDTRLHGDRHPEDAHRTFRPCRSPFQQQRQESPHSPCKAKRIHSQPTFKTPSQHS